MQKQFLAMMFTIMALPSYAESMDSRAAALAEIDFSAFEGKPVAIESTPFGIFVADYVNLYIFRENELRRVKINIPTNWKWNPADVAVSGQNVYIANYTGDSVLVGTISEDGSSIDIDRKIGNANTRSPEGLSIRGNYLAVANYDGDSVQVFRIDAADESPPFCQIPVGLAHGVAFADGFLFATSLHDRKLYKIDPETCRIISAVGGKGRGRGQFLWPTSVADMGDGRIIVSDAHTGNLTILYTADLSVLKSWGGLGPKAFNMPYSVTCVDGKAWVASTYSQTIFEVIDFSWDRVVRYPLTKYGWEWKQGDFDSSSFINSDNWNDYENKYSTEIWRKCYITGYSMVRSCDNHEKLTIPSILGGQYFYYIQSIRGTRGTLLSSPQNRFALYFADDGAPPYVIEIGLDVWVVGDTLVGPNGPISFPIQR